MLTRNFKYTFSSLSFAVFLEGISLLSESNGEQCLTVEIITSHNVLSFSDQRERCVH